MGLAPLDIPLNDWKGNSIKSINKVILEMVEIIDLVNFEFNFEFNFDFKLRYQSCRASN